MRISAIVAAAVFVVGGAMTACTQKGAEDKKLSSNKAKYSYAIGYQFAKNLKQQKVDVDSQVLAMAVRDVLADKDPRISEEDMQAAMQEMYKSRQEEMAKEAEENKAAGQKFLEENKKKEGVKVTDSGLQYKVIEEGEGKSPSAEDVVEVHYKGTLVDGTEFDSSYKRDKPAEFPVKAVIPGWTEALQLMKKGAKWELYIPAELAYGERGRPNIPPNSVLVFEVELLDVKDQSGS